MTQLFKVIKTESLMTNTIELHLRPEQPFAFEAGDYIQMGLHQDDLKPFSISNSPRQNGSIDIHVKNYDNSEFMQQLFELEAGDEVLVDGPHKQYQLDQDLCDGEQTIVLVAGGTGFSPMKALLEQLLATQCNNPIEFYWGARKQDELYYRKTMLALAEHHDNLQYIEVLSEQITESRKGMVHKAVLEDHPQLQNCRVYLCGPWPMVQAAKEDFLAAGLPENKFN